MTKIFESKPKIYGSAANRITDSLVEGARFGRLVVLQRETEDRVVDWDGYGEEWASQPFVVMSCECGEWIKVWLAEFPGKRRMKDCGCGISKDDGTHTLVTGTVPLQVRRLVQEYSVKYNTSFSRAMAELIRKGSEVENG